MDLSQRSFQEGTRYDQSIRLDYTYPFNNNNGKIELGYKREYDKMSSQYYAEQLFDETWRSIPPSNIYDYYQDVNAFYVTSGKQVWKNFLSIRFKV